MDIFDMHIHSGKAKANPDSIIQAFTKANIYGGCIFSNYPKEYRAFDGSDFEERLYGVLEWEKGYKNRIFPILWIHPYEQDIINKIHIAAQAGIYGFKIICTDFYVSDRQCLRVLKEIASLNLPVFFHSGILWDGKNSSEYNRPIHWEALIDIPELRFSMGHCSWPWVDECIALYGKLLNANRGNASPEMFFDLTPGTPEIYRRELLTKLYTIGYDVGNNIMFGSDCTADHYNSDWTAQWVKTDRNILNDLGVSKNNQVNLYSRNLLRFLGKSTEKISHLEMKEDEDIKWKPMADDVQTIITKWYSSLNFPKEYDWEFQEALKNKPISDAITMDDLDCEQPDGKRNLLTVLFLCEDLKEHYAEKCIPEKVLSDTLNDVVLWTITWTNVKGTLFLGEVPWLKNHFNMKLFKLGRLQFCMGKAEYDVPEKMLFKGDPVLEVHIDNSGPLTKTECRNSFSLAKEFFQKYFSQFRYKYFTCESWLLDESMKDLLPDNSNILEFQKNFCIVRKKPSYAILKYVLQWNANRLNCELIFPKSVFAGKVKKEIAKKRTFYEGFGIIEVESIVEMQNK